MMKIIPLKLLILTVIFSCSSFAQNSSYKIALLKYNGGGDWYANPTALSNLILYCNQELGTNIDPVYDEVSVSDQSIYNYPLVHLTGHGNIVLTSQEAKNLRNYLIAGGFLHISDNYGLDPFNKKFKEDEIFELALNSGAKDCSNLENYHEIICEKEDFYKVKIKLEKKLKKYSLKLILLSCPMITLFTIRNLILKMVFQKFTNMLKNPQ